MNSSQITYSANRSTSKIVFWMCACFLFFTAQVYAVPTGSIAHPRQNQTYTSNLLLFFNVSDTTALNSVGLQFGDNNNVTFCNGNCTNRYRGFRTGVNPIEFGLNPGSNTIRLWANRPDNIIDTATFNWQPTQITGINFQRGLGQINFNWSTIAGYRRYNLYIASQPGVTPQNVTSLNGGRAFRSLRNTSQVVTGLDNDISYYARITGIDASGESAFSEEIVIPALNNELPVAVNDQFVVNEDQNLQNNVMNNDFDPDNQGGATPPQTLVASLIEGTSNGSLTLQPSGIFTYVPNANFNGTDRFIYQIKDDLEGIDQATVTITVRAINDAPVAGNDSFSVNEDNQLTVAAGGLLINDSDIDNDALTVNPTPVRAPQFGTLSLSTNGGFTYTPNSNFSGSDSFIYALSDGAVSPQPTAQVSITVNPVNDLPNAVNDFFDLNEDTSVQGNVLDNDTDDDVIGGNKTAELSVSLLSNASSGSLNLGADGQFAYNPNANFFGNDSFQYRITDSAGATSDAQVNITVNSVNDDPVAENDAYSVDEDHSLIVSSDSGLLANDSDTDIGDFITFSELASQPQNGTIQVSADGSFNYTPHENYNGIERFTYLLKDSAGATSSASVEITIVPIPDAPIVENESVEAIAGEALEIDVLSNDTNHDGENSDLLITSASANNGSVVINQGRSLTYSANAGFLGTDTINYAVRHGPDASAPTTTGTVTVEVFLPNDPPTANDDSISTNEDTSITINVLANDTDPENDPLTVIDVVVSTGSVTINADNTLFYSPNDNFHGNATITYIIEDARQQTDSATVNITVVPVNDLPIVENDTATTAEDTPVTIDVLANDSDVDNDDLSIAFISASNGDALVTTDQQITYTPTADFNGESTINYTVSDGNGGSATGSINITVTPVNDPPIANNDTAEVAAGATVTISPLLNDSDPEGDSLSIASISVSVGTATISSGSQIIYTAPAGFNGTATINYLLIDGNGGSDGGVITVTAGDQPPTAASDSYIVNSDGNTVSIPASVGVLSNDTDPEGTTLTATILTSPSYASSFTLNSNGSFDYLHDSTANYSDSFTYSLSDGTNSVTGSVSLSIHTSNHIPELCHFPLTQATENIAYSYSIDAKDIDEDTLTYSASNLPSWLTINSVTGVISGTPGTSDSSASGIVIKASDDRNTSNDYSFSINLQSEFGTSNATTVNIGAADDTVEAMTRDNSGRIVAVGQSSADFAIIRLLPDGTLDTTFSADGIQTIDFGSTDHGYGIAVDKQNRIVVIGQTTDGTNGDAEIGIARLLSDGNLDTSFGGGDGKVEYDVGANTPDYAYDVYIHDNTDITVVGHYFSGADKDLVALQMMDDGTLDTTFGSSGILVKAHTNDQFAYSVISDGQDNLYIGGTHNNGTDDDYLIARINMDSDSNGDEDGQWDTNFDTDGLFFYDGGSTEQGKDISFDADGNLVIAGRHSNNFGIYNFNTTPALNTAGFNSPNGFLVHDLTGTALDVATQVIRDERSNLYVFGKADDDIGIIKINLDGTLDTGFASSGELIVPITGSGTSTVSAMLNGTGQLLYTDTDTTNQEILFYQKNDISDIAFGTCDLTKAPRSGVSTKTTDVIVDVVEAASNEFYAVGYGKPDGASHEDLLIFKITDSGGSVNEFGNAGFLRHAEDVSFKAKSVEATSAKDLIVTGYYNGDQLRVLKFNISGKLDENYATSGKQNFEAAQNVVAVGSSIDASDNVLIGGTVASSSTIRIFKLLSSGALDTSNFGSSGVAEYIGATAKDMAVSADGSIYIAGETNDTTPLPVIIKFTSGGALDTSFGSSGILTFSTTNMVSIAAYSDNSVTVLMDDSGAVLKKVTSAGTVDASFNVDLSLYSISANASIDTDDANNLYIQLNDSSANPALLKMNSSGLWDKTFLNAGQARITGNVSSWTNVRGFEIESTDQLIIFGEMGADFAFAHMDKNGTIIPGEFGLKFDFGFGDHGYGIDLDRKGRILVAGSSYDPTNLDDDQAIARFLNNGSVDTTIDAGDGIHIEDGLDSERFSDLNINTQSKATVSGNDDNNIVIGLLSSNDVSIEGSFNSAAYVVNSNADTDVTNAHYVDDKNDIWTAGSKNSRGRIESIDRTGSIQFAFAESPGHVNYELNLLSNNSELLGITGTSDGQYVAVGKIMGTSEYDAIVVKFDHDGLLDTSFDSDGILYIGVENNLDNILNDVILDASGNIIVVGEENDRIFLGQLSNSGASLGNTTLVSTDSQVAVAAELDNFGGIVVAAQNEHGFELYRFKTDWTQLSHYQSRYIGAASKVRDLTIDTLGNVYLTGSAQIDEEWDIFVLKYPSAVGSFQNLGLD